MSQSRGSGRGGYGRRGRGKGGMGHSQESSQPMPSNEKVAALLSSIRTRLDERNDRYERLVKISRDLTIESKRMIFGLLRSDSEWRAKQDHIIRSCLQPIAAILTEVPDQWHYVRAFSPGLQEFIEAVSLATYLTDGVLIGYSDVVAMCTFQAQDLVKPQKPHRIAGDAGAVGESTGVLHGCSPEALSGIAFPTGDLMPDPGQGGRGSGPEAGREASVLCPHTDYLLGLGDLTGELMRLATYKLNEGDIVTPGIISTFVRELYDAFTLMGSAGMKWKDINPKVTTMRQSLNKVEQICYQIRLRSSDVPKDRLGEVIAMAMASGRAAGPNSMSQNDADDEGIGMVDEF